VRDTSEVLARKKICHIVTTILRKCLVILVFVYKPAAFSFFIPFSGVPKHRDVPTIAKAKAVTYWRSISFPVLAAFASVHHLSLFAHVADGVKCS
jgi:hypothetical protein